MEGYKVTIRYASLDNLSARERIMLKDTSDCVSLDSVTTDGEVTIKPEFYAVLDVHNEYAKDDKDYTQYVIVDADGTKYITGSDSFYSAFIDIADEMGDEAFEIKVYRKPSKNYSGKDFITCSII